MIEIIKDVCASAEPVAMQAWAVMIKQSYVNGVSLLSGYILFAVVLSAFAVAINHKTNPLNFGEYALFYLRIITIAVAVLWVLFLSIDFDVIITYFVNPEYWAMTQLWPF